MGGRIVGCQKGRFAQDFRCFLRASGSAMSCAEVGQDLAVGRCARTGLCQKLDGVFRVVLAQAYCAEKMKRVRFARETAQDRPAVFVGCRQVPCLQTLNGRFQRLLWLLVFSQDVNPPKNDRNQGILADRGCETVKPEGRFRPKR